MIRCLLANNDSVVDKFLSESVLELEYLEKKVGNDNLINCSISEYQVLSETDAKLEAPFLLELRLWHVTLLSSGLGLALVSALCCLVRVRSVSPLPIIIIWCQWCDSRIPRTKSDIEANHKRKALLKQFNGKMKQLNTKDLDDMTYK